MPFPSLRSAYRRIPAFIPLSDSALARGTKRVRLHSVVKLKGRKFDAENLVFTYTTIHRNMNCSHLFTGNNYILDDAVVTIWWCVLVNNHCVFV